MSAIFIAEGSINGNGIPSRIFRVERQNRGSRAKGASNIHRLRNSLASSLDEIHAKWRPVSGKYRGDLSGRLNDNDTFLRAIYYNLPSKRELKYRNVRSI